MAWVVGLLLLAIGGTFATDEFVVSTGTLHALEMPAVLLLVALAGYGLIARQKRRRALLEATAVQEELERDRRERPSMEQAVRDAQERLELIEALTLTGRYEVDLVDGSARWSPGAWALLGLTDDGDCSFERFLAAVHPDDRAGIQQAIASAIESREEFESKFRICRPDGSERSLFSRGVAVYGADDTPVRLFGVTLDVTEQQAADEERATLERQLRQAQKLEAVGQLAGGIAHDFNNLLLALRGYGELASRAAARGEDASHEIHEMLAAADRATALTGQLLAFSRRQMLQPRVVDLNFIVSDMERLLVRLIGEDIDLEVRVGPDPICVNADRSQLEQVVANLAVNARDAMPRGGSLILEISSVDLDWNSAEVEPGRYAVLSVSDTGCGMDSETASQIFEPFFTTKSANGTGLGLATVHGIVKQSNGHIWVYSEPGQGTTFKIYLPLVDGAVERPAEPAAAPAKGGAERVLLLEDDPDVRTIVAQMLGTCGYTVVSAADGDEAIAIAERSEKFDLLLTDVVMSGLSGRETAERIREIHDGIGVLYMSGYTDDAIVRRGALNPGTAFIQKPFSSDELARKVREALDPVAPRRRA
jgi:two-component system, cell cycle sensor histidine kinase and response regulator CckA